MLETTECGNEIRRTFSFAGCDGSEYTLMGKWMDKGYEELYDSAPYYWGIVNKEEMKIFTYTEGDITLIICKDKESFIKELNSYVEFLENSGEAGSNSAKEILCEVRR